MKKLTLLLVLMAMSLGTAFAQFEAGKKYVSVSTTGLGLSYSSSERFRLGLDATVGQFIGDCFMVTANVGYDHTRKIDDVKAGLGARYYFDQCGIYIGAGAEYNHMTKSNNDVMVPITVGYAFFLNRHVTLEPAVYYKMSTHDFSDNSTVGLQIGFGFYF